MTHQGADWLPDHGSPAQEIVPLLDKPSFVTLFRDNTIRVSSDANLSVESIRYGDTSIQQSSVAARGNRWAVLDHNSELVIHEIPGGRRSHAR